LAVRPFSLSSRRGGRDAQFHRAGEPIIKAIAVPRVIRDAIYDVVARNRYRWFGRRDACILLNSDRSWPS
jgi:hypothetical protein